MLLYSYAVLDGSRKVPRVRARPSVAAAEWAGRLALWVATGELATRRFPVTGMSVVKEVPR